MADRPPTPAPSDPPIRVVVIERRPILALGVREVLDQSPDLDVVAHVQSPAEAAEFLEESPDVVLVDFEGAAPSPEMTRRLRNAAPTSAIVVMGHGDDEASIVGAIEIGAVGHVGETAPPDALIETIRRVADGADPLKEELAARPELVERLVDDVREAIVADLGPHVTPRELEILRGASAGQTNRQIATSLGVTEQTVKNHLSTIFHKLGVSNRTRAVLYASRQGWFDAPEPVHAAPPESDTRA